MTCDETSSCTIRFEHRTLGQRVLFGDGTAACDVARAVQRLGAKRVMLVGGDDVANLVAAAIRDVDVAVAFGEVAAHVPIATAVRARELARREGVDVLVAVGGGSTIGLAKAIALTEDIPIVAVPTTYAGSEATNVWGITEGARKQTGVDDRVLPAEVVYDAALTYGLPRDLSVVSGLNAVAHCIDSLWAPNADPINAALATEGLTALAAGLRRVHRDLNDTAGREQCLFGTYLAAVAFASAGPGLHHKICHVLGGAYDLPHARTHAALLPHVLAFNASDAPQAAARVAGGLGAAGPDPQQAVAAFNEFHRRLDAPLALRDCGMREQDLPEALELILPLVPRGNPRPVNAETLGALLGSAWRGDEPAPQTPRKVGT